MQPTPSGGTSGLVPANLDRRLRWSVGDSTRQHAEFAALGLGHQKHLAGEWSVVRLARPRLGFKAQANVLVFDVSIVKNNVQAAPTTRSQQHHRFV